MPTQAIAQQQAPPGYVGRAITNQPMEVRPNVPGSKWEVFGRALLAFHLRVGVTAMCQCGRTIVECDVRRQAEQHGIVLPQ